MTCRCHHRNQRVDARNRIQVPFCPVLLVSHRNHSSLNWINLRLNVRTSDVLQYPQLCLQFALLYETCDLLNPYALVNLTVHFEVQELTTLNNSVPQVQQQNVPTDHFVDLFYVFCCWLEVKVQVKILNKLDERVWVLHNSSLHDFCQFVQIEWVISVFVQVFVHDCGNCQVSQQVWWKELDDWEAGLVIAKVNVLFEIFVSGLCEVNQGCQS